MNSTNPRLALVEDYQDLREELLSLLQARGYACWGADSAEAFYKQLHRQRADIVLVDLGLPGEDGLSLIAELRQQGIFGLIAVTARGRRDDRLAGLRQGADDYLVKPVDPDELCARIDNLWRRLTGDPLKPQEPASAWQFHEAQQAIISPQGQTLCLSEQEVALLKPLIEQPGQVWSKGELHQALFPQATDIATHRIDVILNRIRTKAQKAGMQLPIRAVFGKGLVFVH